MTDAWDPSIPTHKELQHQIELGNGIPEMRTIRKSREALLSVGFEIEHEEDLADRPDEIRWYYPLEGDLSKAQTLWDLFTVWRMSWSGKFVTHSALWVFEKIGMLPKGTVDVGETLKIAADALVKGGQTKVRGLLMLWASVLTVLLTAVHTDVPRHLPEAYPKLRQNLAHYPECHLYPF
jgi:sterol 24-C-methyltransferase